MRNNLNNKPVELINTVVRELKESARVNKAMADILASDIAEAAKAMIDAYKSKRKILLIGNGGSAADAQHLAAELGGRFKLKRKSLPAIALTTNTSILTALANDYGYDAVFSRQLQAMATRGDVLVAISTSGTSRNILKAVETARALGVVTIGLTGEKGDKLKDACDLTIKVPSNDTARIQEAHITIGHIICLLIEKELFGKKSRVSR